MTRAREGCCDRTCTTIWIFSLLAIKVLPQVAPATIIAADGVANFSAYAIFSPYPPGDKLTKSYENYTFKKSLFDVLVTSEIRCVLLLVVYLVATIRKNLTSYYYFSLLIAFATFGFLAVKASLYDYSVDQKLYSNFPLFGPMLMLFNIAIAITHVGAAKTADVMMKRRRRLVLGRFGLSRSKTNLTEHLLSKDSSGDLEEPEDVGSTANAGADKDRQEMTAKHFADKDSNFLSLSEQVSVHYKEFNYQAENKDDGKAVLILHGFCGNVFCWENIAYPLAQKTKCRVVVCDRIGFGLSSRPSRNSTYKNQNLYSMLAQTDIIFELCDRLGIKELILMAHDDAAMLALLMGEMTSAEPHEALSSKVGNKKMPNIQSIAFLHPNVTTDLSSSLVEHLLTSNIKGSTRKKLVRMEIEVSLRRQCYRPFSISPKQMEQYRTPLYVKGWDSALKYVLEASRGNTKYQWNECLNKISNMRVFLATGAHDSIVRPESVKSLAAALSNYTFHEFENCGHLSHEECSEELVDVVSKFLT